MEKEKFIESIEKMTVLELSELVKALEEKFGVSASIPMMMGGGAASAAGAGEEEASKEEQTSFTVELTAGGSQKINVIKALRELTQLGLKESKDLVDGAPKVVKEGITKDEADAMKQKLEGAGATVTIK